MGDRRLARAVVLCEDQEHRTFALRYLYQKFGLTTRQIRVNMSPPASGSAEQYVRREFSGEVRAYRRHANAVATCLLVITDADVRTVAARIAELEQCAARISGDRVALFVPRRNIETWAYSTTSPDANESDDYAPQRADDIRRAADNVARVAPSDLPSVCSAMVEAERLDNFDGE